jgi:hypothetical protein
MSGADRCGAAAAALSATAVNSNATKSDDAATIPTRSAVRVVLTAVEVVATSAGNWQSLTRGPPPHRTWTPGAFPDAHPRSRASGGAWPRY